MKEAIDHLSHDMRLQAAKCMENEGGSFAGHIARAFYVADYKNEQRLVNTFADLFCKFYMEHLRNERMKERQEMNWDNTQAVFDGEDWVFTGVPIEAGWDTGTTAFSPYELGVCSTPEQAINALKDWVQSTQGETK